MRRLFAFLLLLSALMAACSKCDPPCPPNAKEVLIKEADEALTRRVRRLMDEANALEKQGKHRESEAIGEQRAATFNCGYSRKPDGSYHAADQVDLWVADVAECITNPLWTRFPLHACMWAMARSRYAGRLSDPEAPVEVLMQLASKIDCQEFSRDVDVEADKHGLQRVGGQSWVPAIIWAVIQSAENMSLPAPALFLITPKSGAEEACVDTSEPARRCTDQSGCGDVPAGTDSPDAGGVLVPPGTTPGGGAAGSGDYQ